MEKVTKMTNQNDLYKTSFHGDTICASFDELEKKFGLCANYEGDSKVNYEMDLEVAGIPFSIYDWKEGEIEKTDRVRLHIGARTAEESRKVRSMLREYGV